MEVNGEQLVCLAPYLEGAKPDHRGEMEMYCPVHPDTRRSASINLKKGVWFCHAGCGGGSIRQLVDSKDAWVAMEGRDSLSIVTPGVEELGAVDRYDHIVQEAREDHQRLLEEAGQRRRLFRLRGINRTTVEQHRIGFNGRYFRIPIFSPGPFEDRKLWNVRTYDPSPRFGRRKIWGVRGMNKGRLYPAGVLDGTEPGDSVLFCEGEWDALLALQAGHLAVTTTSGAGKPWQEAWNVAFAGLRVYLCHDADTEGQKANRIVAEALKEIAEVFICKLPYDVRPNHGKDITDYLINEDDPYVALDRLVKNAKPYKKELVNV